MERRSKQLGTVKPVPVKFMVPFLEQASLEDPESSLVELWANLLASAAEGFDPHHIHFISIISRMSPAQGQILKELIDTESVQPLAEVVRDLDEIYAPHVIERNVVSEVAEGVEDNEIVDDLTFSERIKRYFSCRGIQMVHAAYGNQETEEFYDISFENRGYGGSQNVDCLILQALGLIQIVDTTFFDVDRWSLTLSYRYLTVLGLEFAKACKIVT
jgi:hypothetical protein